MPYYSTSQQNEPAKPDIRDLLGLLQYMSPEAQQERQAQLQLLQARLGTEQGTQAHEAAATAQLQALTQHLPDEWQQQASELAARQSASAATTAAESTRNKMEQNIVRNQPQAFADTHAKELADTQEATNRGLITQPNLGPILDAATNGNTLPLDELRANSPTYAAIVDAHLKARGNAVGAYGDLASRTGHTQATGPITVGNSPVPSTLAPRVVGPSVSLTDPATGQLHYFDRKTGQRTAPPLDSVGVMGLLNAAPLNQNQSTPDITSFLSNIPKQTQPDPVATMIGSVINSPYAKF